MADVEVDGDDAVDADASELILEEDADEEAMGFVMPPANDSNDI